MFWDLLLLAEKVQKDEIWNIAAQLSYFLLLSFFPFMIAIVSLLEYEPAAISLLMEQLEAILPKVSYQLIQENVQVFSEWNSGMFSGRGSGTGYSFDRNHRTELTGKEKDIIVLMTYK